MGRAPAGKLLGGDGRSGREVAKPHLLRALDPEAPLVKPAAVANAPSRDTDFAGGLPPAEWLPVRHSEDVKEPVSNGPPAGRLYFFGAIFF